MLDVGPAFFQFHLRQCCLILCDASNFSGMASDMQNGSYSDLFYAALVVHCNLKKKIKITDSSCSIGKK